MSEYSAEVRVNQGNRVRVQKERTWPSKVTAWVGKDPNQKDIWVTFPVVFRLLTDKKLKELTDSQESDALMRAVLASAEIDIEDANGTIDPDPIGAIANDPSLSTAVMNKYRKDAVEKNDQSKK